MFSTLHSGGFDSGLTPENIAAVRAVDAMAQERGRPVTISTLLDDARRDAAAYLGGCQPIYIVIVRQGQP